MRPGKWLKHTSIIAFVRLVTCEEYKHFPDDGVRHEIIHGVHYASPSPSTSHQNTSRHIQCALYESRGVPEYWVVDIEKQCVYQYLLEGVAYREPIICREQITFRSSAAEAVVELADVWQKV